MKLKTLDVVLTPDPFYHGPVQAYLHHTYSSSALSSSNGHQHTLPFVLPQTLAKNESHFNHLVENDGHGLAWLCDTAHAHVKQANKDNNILFPFFRLFPVGCRRVDNTVSWLTFSNGATATATTTTTTTTTTNNNKQQQQTTTTTWKGAHEDNTTQRKKFASNLRQDPPLRLF